METEREMSDQDGLILASTSAARRHLLTEAGLRFTVVPSGVDEAAVQAEGLAPADLALALALAKAGAVSARRRGAFVVGADQVLVQDGEIFHKPASLAAAAAHLRRLRGRSHQLITAVCLVRDGTEIWRHVDAPRLRMRAFSDEFLDWYLAVEGETVLACPGAYRVEGPGIQLFETIAGDYFTILGLPLLPLLDALRRAYAALAAAAPAPAGAG
jgi:septum formation protein